MRVINRLRVRPSLLTGIGVAALAGAALSPVLRPMTTALVAWDLGVVAYVARLSWAMFPASPEVMRRRAALLDEGQWMILALTIGAAIACLAAILLDLAASKGAPGLTGRALLAAITVLLSWTFVHAVFAQHYAHLWYRARGGLDFPGTPDPNAADFVYFSFVIGMTFQVSDVQVTSQTMRRLVGLVSLQHGNPGAQRQPCGRSRVSRLAGFARCDWLGRDRVAAYPRLFLALYLAIGLLWVGLAHGLIDRMGKPLGTDFIDVWAAGRLALAGEPQAAWDWARHGEAEREAVGGADIPYYGWHYPPIFLLVAAPLAFLPYAAALAAYVALGLILYAFLMRRVVPAPEGMAAALAFPGVFSNVGHGQNGFLTVALLGFGLLRLERRPALAGVLLGLLAYKPQFAVLVPLALLAGGHWRALLAAAASAFGAALLSLAVFGPASWDAFFASAALTRGIVLEEGATGWERIVSVFAAARMLGAGVGAAYAAQGAAAILAALCVAWVWRGRAPLRLKAAGLCAAIPLATPYLLDYDLIILALPIAWLAGEGLEAGFRPWEKPVLLLAWLVPLIARPIGAAAHIPLAPAIVAALLVTALLRVLGKAGPLA